MSFSPEVFRKKLDALQETQDSIVSISQWVLFHHRHAAHLCELWAEYTLAQNPSNLLKKKLSLLYLCNDVVQQARHKRKPEFIAGFAAKLPSVLHAIYGTVDESIKPKIERLISVWSQRNVFSKPQIDSMNQAVEFLKNGKEYNEESLAEEAALKNLLKANSGPQIAPDLAALNLLYTQMTQLLEKSLANLAQIDQQAKVYLPEDPSSLDNLPLPKVYVSKLNVLEKLCLMTVQTLQDTLKSRLEIAALLTLLASLVSGGLLADNASLELLLLKLAQILETRKELLEMIDEQEPATTAVSESSQVHDNVRPDEEPSPIFETASTSSSSQNENLVPTYEDSSDDSDSTPAPQPKRSIESDTSAMQKKRKVSDTSSISGTSGISGISGISKKSVAFSEEIQVKEFERDDQANYVDIIGNLGVGANATDEDEDEDYPENDAPGFEIRHKDAVELKHEHQADQDHDQNDDSSFAGDQDKGGLLSLLSKLS